MVVRARRSDRKAQKRDAAPPGPAENGSDGSATEAAVPQLNGRSGLRLQKVLLQRHLVTEAQIEHALASDPPRGRLRRCSGQHARSSMSTSSSRPAPSSTEWTSPTSGKRSPEQEALDLIPESMAREHFVIPMALDEVGLHVAMADQPSNELISAPRRDERDHDPPHARAALRDPPRHREQLPGHRRPRPPRPGLRGGRGHPETAHRHHALSRPTW